MALLSVNHKLLIVAWVRSLLCVYTSEKLRPGTDIGIRVCTQDTLAGVIIISRSY